MQRTPSHRVIAPEDHPGSDSSYSLLLKMSGERLRLLLYRGGLVIPVSAPGSYG